MKRILIIFLAIVLTSCSASIPNDDLMKDAKKLISNQCNNTASYNTNNYSSYLTYEISETMNYKESLELVLISNDLIRHSKVYVNIDEAIFKNETTWYDYDFSLKTSPYYFESVLSNTEVAFLSDSIGQSLYSDDYSKYKDSTATVSYLIVNMNDDGVMDYVSYLTAGWIQGENYNITLQVDVSENNFPIKVVDDIFLNYKDDNLSFSDIHIMNTSTNGLRDILVETFSRRTAEYQKKLYKFDGHVYR